MPPTRRHTTSAHRRLALLALGVALGLGVAGRVAIHAGGHLPHGDALAALGRAAVALGGPWLAAAWTIGALAGSRRPRSARRRRGARAGHRGLVPAHGGRGRSRGRGLRGARRRGLGRRRAGRRRALRPGRRRAGATAPPRVRAAAIAVLAGALAGEALLLAGAVGGPRGGAGAGRRARRRASGCWPPPAAGRRWGSRWRSSRSPRWPSRASRTACATRCAWPAGPVPSAPSRSRASRSRSSLRPMTQKAAATPTTAPEPATAVPTAVSASRPPAAAARAMPIAMSTRAATKPRI